MSYYSDKQVFYINSRDRVNGDDSEFTINLDIDTTKDFDHVVVLDCSVPKSYYVIPLNQNTFTVLEPGTVTPSKTITIPIGNYTRSSLKNVLNALLVSTAQTSWNYVVSFSNSATSADTGKFTFTVTGNSGVQPQFIFTDSMFEQLGFNGSSTNIFSTDTLTSTNVINMAKEGTLFIHSDCVQNKSDNILCNIITQQDANFSYIIYNNLTPQEYSKRLISKPNNTFYFKLVNEDGQKIFLNGLNLVFTLMLYKEDRINSLIKGFLKLATLEILNNDNTNDPIKNNIDDST